MESDMRGGGLVGMSIKGGGVLDLCWRFFVDVGFRFGPEGPLLPFLVFLCWEEKVLGGARGVEWEGVWVVLVEWLLVVEMVVGVVIVPVEGARVSTLVFGGG